MYNIFLKGKRSTKSLQRFI